MIELLKVSKSYFDKNSNEFLILDDISFLVESGKFINIMGPSGCGKTTLLNMIAGINKPTKGVVKFNDKAVTNPSPERTVIFRSMDYLIGKLFWAM